MPRKRWSTDGQATFSRSRSKLTLTTGTARCRPTFRPDCPRRIPTWQYRSSRIPISSIFLAPTHRAAELEQGLVDHIQKFLMEFFVGRQIHLEIGADDFYLDLLFYHRSLRRLVAIELKLGPFEPAHKGQMELYLRWLDKHERHLDSEGSPIGLILCSAKDEEQVELLQLSEGEIRVAEYLTALPDPALLRSKLHAAVARAREQLAVRTRTDDWFCGYVLEAGAAPLGSRRPALVPRFGRMQRCNGRGARPSRPTRLSRLVHSVPAYSNSVPAVPKVASVASDGRDRASYSYPRKGQTFSTVLLSIQLLSSALRKLISSRTRASALA